MTSDDNLIIPKARLGSLPMTPLWVISLFVSLTEVVTGIAVTQATGSIQVALTVFVMVFPLLVASAFFVILWDRHWVLYPPTEFVGIDVKEYMNSMLRRKIRSEQPPKMTDFPDEEGEAGSNTKVKPTKPQLPPGITNTLGWRDEQIKEKLEQVKKEKLDWDNTTGSARKWWQAFEKENTHRYALVLRLAEELAIRNATITEFFLAYVYSNTDNIQANLYYLDYTQLKKKEDLKKKSAESTSG